MLFSFPPASHSHPQSSPPGQNRFSPSFFVSLGYRPIERPSWPRSSRTRHTFAPLVRQDPSHQQISVPSVIRRWLLLASSSARKLQLCNDDVAPSLRQGQILHGNVEAPRRNDQLYITWPPKIGACSARVGRGPAHVSFPQWPRRTGPHRRADSRKTGGPRRCWG